ncbi:hypothetical protein BG015_000414 [Linnemannia schmuckeri]|uniref:Uncharacterized protein n=1 Tax=Linnemannia schmuckeri TaxID=64567 RepID=A0A9P5RT72_9FUNG|nr:hypothetical protein BG015_000414 [Linnemannia schmuckeri]
MTHLSVLGLGMEYRDINLQGKLGAKPISIIRRGAQTYIDWGPIPPDTLKLSPASGLDQLSALRNLREFGFEGVDYRIDEEELR